MTAMTNDELHRETFQQAANRRGWSLDVSDETENAKHVYYRHDATLTLCREETLRERLGFGPDEP
jgi:hypothetical protein